MFKQIIFSFILLIFLSIGGNAQCFSDGHSNHWADAWTSCVTSSNPNTIRGNSHWILYDFGQPYFLGNTHVWNANENGQTNKGIRDVVIDYSMDGNTWLELGTYQFAQGNGQNDYQGFIGPDLGGLNAQYLLLTVISTWGNPCASLAELKIDIADRVSAQLSVNVLLEGAYSSNGQMNTLLGNIIPLNQPYNTAPFYYNGTETLSSIPSDMVDWVMVEIREGSPNVSIVKGTYALATQAGILKSNGDIVGTDGNPLSFELAQNRSYHICVRHRNHLDVLSSTPIMAANQMVYDFSNNINKAFGLSQMKSSMDGHTFLFAGDLQKDGTIQTTDYNLWKSNPAIINTYQNADANLDGTVQVTDFNTWFVNRSKVGVIEIEF